MTGHDESSAAFWEARYQGMNRSWGTQPNALLKEAMTALGLPPGRALDLGCGHGGDALWLASLGWHVTAVDIAPTALVRVAAAAAQAGVGERVSTEHHDISRSLPAGAFDLVYACYAHSHVDIGRDAVLARAAGQVEPGGRLIVVDHASLAPWSDRDHAPTSFPSAEQTWRSIGLSTDWNTERVTAVERVATHPDGRAATVTDNLIVARRRA